MKRPFIRFSIALAITSLTAWFFFSPAFAHAFLIRSDPADNAVLDSSPEEIRLWYDEPISPEFSKVRLIDQSGNDLALSGPIIEPTDPTLLVFDTPELKPGVFSVNWEVLSKSDGHVSRGYLIFRIGSGVGGIAPVTAALQDKTPIIEIFLRWINFVLYASVIGSIATKLLVLRESRYQNSLTNPQIREYIGIADRRILKWANYATFIALLANIAWYIYQFFTLNGKITSIDSAANNARRLLVATRWGELWMTRCIILISIIGVLEFGKGTHKLFLIDQKPSIRLGSTKSSNFLPVVFAFLAVFLAITITLSGHAATVKPLTSIAILSDILHILAASLWVGGLLSLVVGVLPLIIKHPSEAKEIASVSLGRFSGWAALSAAVLIVTGIYNTGRQVLTPDALISTNYGKALTGKVLLMIVAGCFGLTNSLLIHPRLRTWLKVTLRFPEGWSLLDLRHLPVFIIGESALGMIILLVVGVLTSSIPARGPEFTPPNDLDSLSQTVDDLVITFSAKPNVPGWNIFTIRANSQRRPPPYQVLRVIIRFTYLDEDFGTVSTDASKVNEGVYVLNGSYFGLAGKWKVQVAVRRKGVEDSVATFDWTVNPPGPRRAVIISNQPWERSLNIISLSLIVLFVCASVLIWHRIKASSASLPEIHDGSY